MLQLSVTLLLSGVDRGRSQAKGWVQAAFVTLDTTPRCFNLAVRPPEAS